MLLRRRSIPFPARLGCSVTATCPSFFAPSITRDNAGETAPYAWTPPQPHARRISPHPTNTLRIMKPPCRFFFKSRSSRIRSRSNLGQHFRLETAELGFKIKGMKMKDYAVHSQILDLLKLVDQFRGISVNAVLLFDPERLGPFDGAELKLPETSRLGFRRLDVMVEVHLEATGYVHGVACPSRLRHTFLKPLNCGRERSKDHGGPFQTRRPTVRETGHPPQGGLAVSAHPNGRMGLLEGFGLKNDVFKLKILSPEAGRRLCQQQLEGFHD